MQLWSKEYRKIADATGLSWRERGDGWIAYWIAPAKLADVGFEPKTKRLWPPADVPHPGRLTKFDRDYIAHGCSRLTAETKLWKSDGRAADIGKVQVQFSGTVRSLSHTYQTDELSPFHALRFGVKKYYLSNLRIIEDTVGDRVIANLDARWLKNTHKEWDTKADGSKYRARGRMLMTMFRIIISFGAGLLEDRHCQRIATLICSKSKGERSLVTFNGGHNRREVELTVDHAVAIRRKAHEMGYPEVALAQAVQFELAMRPKDVVGEWLPLSEPGESDITARGKKWLLGARWDEIAPGHYVDVDGRRQFSELLLTHRVSKSIRGRDNLATDQGKTRTWDLTLSPMIMEELLHWSFAKRVGPLIVNPRTGLPFNYDYYNERWRKIADAAGVPKNVQNRDARAGALTETEAAVGIEHSRAVGTHSEQDTTQIYIRGENAKIANAAVERAKRRRNRDSNVRSNAG